jgi:DNA primase
VTESPIVAAIQRYHPDWEPPKGNGMLWSVWSRCRCPFHGDEVASAAVNYYDNVFNCLACGVRGNPVQIIKTQEGVSHREAKRIAAELSEGSDAAVPPSAPRKRGRRVFEDTGTRLRKLAPGEQPQVPTRVRRRPPSWT